MDYDQLKSVEDTIAQWKTYNDYADSGLSWLGNIPSHWNVAKLKNIADVRTSNVDKKSIEDDVPVVLCNYTDVYYNEYITDDMDFMKATATIAQVKQFELQAGDVIITKDSESWDDIAVPACVQTDLQGVVCGYHLALIRPDKRKAEGKYIFRVFASVSGAYQFKVSANGITRYGLPQKAIKDAWFPVPPTDEQQAIATFLDRETAKIDDLIAKKQRLIELLQEQRSAIISHAVTKGLDPDVPMKDSGIEWLGEIPAHWEYAPVKYYSDRILDCKNRTPDYFPDGEYLVVRTTNVRDGKLTLNGALYTDEANFKIWTQRGVPKPRDVMITREAPAGESCLVPKDLKLCLGQRMMLITPKKDVLSPEYLLHLIYSPLIRMHVEFSSFGSTVSHMRVFEIHNLPCLLPPYHEQQKIVEYINQEIMRIDSLLSKTRQTIESLKEYRTALISSAVTGKVDVRNEV
jgi:type I restriction enzyme, S subunit